MLLVTVVLLPFGLLNGGANAQSIDHVIERLPHVSGWAVGTGHVGGNGSCDEDGGGTTSPGTSLQGHWTILLDVVEAPGGLGGMALCGRIGPSGPSTGWEGCDGNASWTHFGDGFGTKGWDGQGALSGGLLADDPVLLDDLGWNASFGWPYSALVMSGKVVDSARNPIGHFDAVFTFQAGCTGATVVGAYTIAYDVPPIDPEPSPSEPCESDDTRVTRVPGEVGDPSDPNHLAYEIDVHQTDEEVQVCVQADRGGQPFVDRYVRVPTDPGDPEPGDPPIEVDASAPPGDGAGSPCNQQITSAGGDPHAFIRRSSSTAPAVVCVGFRNGDEESHIWVTIG